MCGPAVAVGLMVASAVVSTIGAVQQASAQAKSARYAADATQDQARAEEALQRNQARRLLGQQQAAFAASGVRADSGSPLDVAADSAAQAELDALTIRQRGRVASDFYKFQARQARSTIPLTILGGTLNAASAFSSGPPKAPAGGPSGNAAIGSSFTTTASRNAAYGGYWS